MAGDPGVDEEHVLVDQIQPVELGRELAATEEHAGRGRVLTGTSASSTTTTTRELRVITSPTSRSRRAG